MRAPHTLADSEPSSQRSPKISFAAAQTDLQIQDDQEGRRARHFVNEQQTGGENVVIEMRSARPPSVARIYPHVFGKQLFGQEALRVISSAICDTESAIEDFRAADLRALLGRLSQVAAAMTKAQSLGDFNPEFGAVVAYVRRAALAMSANEITLPALNVLLVALRTIAENPLMTLDDASDLVNRLSNEGWRGDHPVTLEILSAILDDSDENIDHSQSLLFPFDQPVARVD